MKQKQISICCVLGMVWGLSLSPPAHAQSEAATAGGLESFPSVAVPYDPRMAKTPFQAWLPTLWQYMKAAPQTDPSAKAHIAKVTRANSELPRCLFERDWESPGFSVIEKKKMLLGNHRYITSKKGGADSHLSRFVSHMGLCQLLDPTVGGTPILTCQSPGAFNHKYDYACIKRVADEYFQRLSARAATEREQVLSQKDACLGGDSIQPCMDLNAMLVDVPWIESLALESSELSNHIGTVVLDAELKRYSQAIDALTLTRAQVLELNTETHQVANEANNALMAEIGGFGAKLKVLAPEKLGVYGAWVERVNPGLVAHADRLIARSTALKLITSCLDEKASSDTALVACSAVLSETSEWATPGELKQTKAQHKRLKAADAKRKAAMKKATAAVDYTVWNCTKVSQRSGQASREKFYFWYSPSAATLVAIGELEFELGGYPNPSNEFVRKFAKLMNDDGSTDGLMLCDISSDKVFSCDKNRYFFGRGSKTRGSIQWYASANQGYPELEGTCTISRF